MSSSSIAALWKALTNLSGTQALVLGFLLLCAIGGACIAIYVGIRAVLDAREERRMMRARDAQFREHTNT